MPDTNALGSTYDVTVANAIEHLIPAGEPGHVISVSCECRPLEGFLGQRHAALFHRSLTIPPPL